jgi:hypothetical protein
MKTTFPQSHAINSKSNAVGKKYHVHSSPLAEGMWAFYGMLQLPLG